MIVSIPFHKGEIDAVRRLLEWMHNLDPVLRHDLKLFGSSLVDNDTVLELAAPMKGHCNSITCHRITCTIEGKWPQSPNQMFCTVAKQMSMLHLPWLWLEPDAVPLCPQWLDILEAEYRKQGKPFMGGLSVSPKPHLSGIAIYPPDVKRYNPAMTVATTLPFDYCNPQATMKQAHVTPLIQHVWSVVNGHTVPTFLEASDLSIIKPEAVLFHRCKDGTLIDRLSERIGCVEPVEYVQKRSTKMDNERGGLVGKFLSIFIPKVRTVQPKLEEIPCIIQLGRIGDILNVLPVARFLNSVAHHQPVTMFVHQKMAHTVARVGYVKPIEWRGDINDRRGAEDRAKKAFGTVMVPQLFDFDGVDASKTPHYNLDQWERCGVQWLWGALPHEIDRRDWKAEQKWLEGTGWDGRKPMVCYNLEGQSSPWTGAAKFEEWLKAEFGDAFLLNLSAHKSRCYTDQLAALDRCHFLITIDTSTLHLAQASHCPYIALLSDLDPSGWKETATRRKPILGIPYAKINTTLDRLKLEIQQALGRVFRSGIIWHCVPRRQTQDPRLARFAAYWDRQYAAGAMQPVHVWPGLRDAKTVLGDKRDLPFLRDCLEVALLRAGDADIILFTNDDVAVTERCLEEIRQKLRFVNMVTGGRIDLRGTLPDHVDGCAQWDGSRHLGRDAVAFNAGWLRRNIHLIPDFVLGASEWDLCLAALARKLAGAMTTPEGIGMAFPECELLPGGILHEKHQAQWSSQANYLWSPGQINNMTLAEEWMRTNTPRMSLAWYSRT